jgi:hypothetical protein
MDNEDNRYKVLSFLIAINACSDAKAWVRYNREDYDFEKAWNVCPRGDWLAWVLAELIVRNGRLEARRVYLEPKWGTLAACAAAECARPHISAGPWSDKASALIHKVKAWATDDGPFTSGTYYEALGIYDARDRERRSSEGHALVAAAKAGMATGPEVVLHLCPVVFAAIDAVDPNFRRTGIPARIERNEDIAKAIRKVVPWAVVEAGVNKLRADYGVLGESQEEGG